MLAIGSASAPLSELLRWGLWILLNPPDATLWQLADAFFYRWQTLIAGGIAFAGAGLTVAVLIRQQKDEKRRRDLLARLELMDGLPIIGGYLIHCYEWWEARGAGERRPEPPKEALEALSRVAPDVDPSTLEWVFKLLKTARTFESRAEAGAGGTMRHILIGDIAYMSYLNNNLFSYARDDTAAVMPGLRVTRSNLKNSVPRNDGALDPQELRREIDAAIDRSYRGFPE